MPHRNFATKIQASRVPDSKVAVFETASKFSHRLGQESPISAMSGNVRSSHERTFIARRGYDCVSPIPVIKRDEKNGLAGVNRRRNRLRQRAGTNPAGRAP